MPLVKSLAPQTRERIRLVVFDVDGTLTDGKIYMGEQGEVFKVFDIKDGLGIHDLLPRYGIASAVITARTSGIVANRCRELGIEYCRQGIRDKVGALAEIARELGLAENESRVYEEAAYMGDDLIDLPCMLRCGLIACPSNAAGEVREVAHFCSDQPGGDGAARQFIEWLVEPRRTEEKES